MVFESSRAAGDPDTTPKPKPEAYRRHLEPSNTYVYALQPGKKKKKKRFPAFLRHKQTRERPVFFAPQREPQLREAPRPWLQP